MENGRRKLPLYLPTITTGNVLTLVSLAAGFVTFWLTDHDKLITVQAAQVSAEMRDMQFRQQVLQRLQDLQTDVREIRAQTGVNWRELPPSRYKK